MKLFYTPSLLFIYLLTFSLSLAPLNNVNGHSVTIEQLNDIFHLKVMLDQVEVVEEASEYGVVSKIISLEFAGVGEVKMVLFDEEGNKIAQRIMFAEDDTINRAHIPVVRWKEGVYKIEIHTDTQVHTYDLKIQR